MKSNSLNNYLGVALIIIGAILLIVSHLAGWTSSNLVLLSGLIIIILGVILDIRRQKRCDKY